MSFYQKSIILVYCIYQISWIEPKSNYQIVKIVAETGGLNAWNLKEFQECFIFWKKTIALLYMVHPLHTP